MSRAPRSLACLAAGLLLAVPAARAGGEDLSYCIEGSRESQSGRFDEAIELFDKCIRKGDLGPQSLVRAYRNLGLTWRSKGDPKKAIEYFSLALAQNPRDPWADYLDRASARSDAGEYDEALADYGKVLELRPEYAQAYFDRGLTFERMNRKDEAYADFTRAHDLGMQSDALTARIQAHKGGPVSREGGPFAKLGPSYSMARGRPAPAVGEIWSDSNPCLDAAGDGVVATPLSPYPGAESLRGLGRFEFPGGNGGVTVAFPLLPGIERPDIRVHLGDHSRGVRDDYLSFAPAPGAPVVAAVVQTTLPKRMQSASEARRSVGTQIESQSLRVPPEAMVVRDLDGPRGLVVEVLVANRTATACFPTAPFARLPDAEGLRTIGVTRYLHRGILLVELALIVPIPKDVPGGEQAEYARARMDELMGAVSLPE